MEPGQILVALAGGDTVSLNQLYDLVFAELRAIAGRKMASERPGYTLQPTALVNEAYLRLGGSAGFKFENRAHFFTTTAEAMHRILVDNARRHSQPENARHCLRHFYTRMIVFARQLRM